MKQQKHCSMFARKIQKFFKNKKNVKKIKEIFTKKYEPYEIGFVSKEKSKIKVFEKS